MDRVANLIWNLFIPVAGALVFNVIGDAVHYGAKTPIPLSDLDFSIGTAFAIVGVAAAQTSPERQRWMFGLLLIVYIGTQFVDIFLRYRFPEWEAYMIVVSDAFSICAAGFRMWNAR
jgi:hypothetical protein